MLSPAINFKVFKTILFLGFLFFSFIFLARLNSVYAKAVLDTATVGGTDFMLTSDIPEEVIPGNTLTIKGFVGITSGGGFQTQPNIPVTLQIYPNGNPIQGIVNQSIRTNPTPPSEYSFTIDTSKLEPGKDYGISISSDFETTSGKVALGVTGAFTALKSAVNAAPADGSTIDATTTGASSVTTPADTGATAVDADANCAGTSSGVALSPDCYDYIYHGQIAPTTVTQFIGCDGAGLSLFPLHGCITENSETGELFVYDYKPGGGALGTLAGVMDTMYNQPPTSTQAYLADLGSNLGLVDTAYAQSLGVGGSGDQILNPILNLWKVMRNIAYLAFIVVFIIVGVMIMFRQKLNPQTVVTIQSALPGLVIGLILVTFSYFISALIVDFSFVSMKTVAFVFQQSGTPNIIQEGCNPILGLCNGNAQKLSTNGNMFSLYWAFINNGSLKDNIITPMSGMFNVQNVFDTNVDLKAGTATSNAANTGILGNVWNAVRDPLATAQTSVTTAFYSFLGGVLGAVIAAIVIVALLIQMFRLLWGLLSAYITILIFAVAGPLFILVGSLPGKGGVITYWWKNLLGNILIFPAVFAAFLFAGMILAQGDGNPTFGNVTHAMPLFVGLPFTMLKAIIGYGIVLGSPAIPGMVKQAMGIKDLTELQKAAFAGLGSGAAPFGSAVSKFYEPYKVRTQAAKEAILRDYYTSPAGREAIRGKGGILQGIANRLGGLPSAPLNDNPTPINSTTPAAPAAPPASGTTP